MSDGYQISGWLEGCLQREIERHVINEQERIIKLLEAQPCDTKAGHPYECNCEGYETAIAIIKGNPNE